MRGYYSALITLILLSGANALTTAGITNAQDTLYSKDNLTINYAIIFSTNESTSYTIYLNEIAIINNTENIQEINRTINYNITDIPSGNYALSLKVNRQDTTLTDVSTKNITILKDVGLRENIPEKIFITGTETTTSASLTNEGNTELSISAYFKNAKSEVSINPQSFQLRMHETRQLTINVKKPDTDYSMTLVVNAISQQDEINREYSVQVLQPNVNLSMTNLNVKENANDTTVTMTLNSIGNMPVNATINIRTFSISEGFKTSNETITLNANQELNYTRTISHKGVTGVSINYNNGTSNVETSQELNIMNKIPLDITLSTDRIALIAILVVVLIGIVYFKKRGVKARP